MRIEDVGVRDDDLGTGYVWTFAVREIENKENKEKRRSEDIERGLCESVYV